MDKNRAVLGLIALVVLVSGCSNGESGVAIGQTDGVSIERFSASPTEVFDGQLTTIELQLKNNGGQNAENVQAKLFNVPFEGDRSWKDSDGTGVRQKKEYGNLGPPDPDTDTPSITVPKTWTLQAPNLDSSVSIPYDFYVRVFYGYETRGVTDIRVMSDTRFREEGTTRSQPTLDNTGGPVQLKVRTRTPLIFFEGESEQRKTDFCVIAENDGSGTPFHPDADYSQATEQENVDKVVLKIQSSGKVVDFQKQRQEVSLVGGEGVACFPMTSDFNPDSGIQQTVPIEVTASYGYYIDDQASVTVNGRKSGRSYGGGDGGDGFDGEASTGESTTNDDPSELPTPPKPE